MINAETLEMRQKWVQKTIEILQQYIEDNGWDDNARAKGALLADDLNTINNLAHLLKCDGQIPIKNK